jgi:hypothetical protein
VAHVSVKGKAKERIRLRHYARTSLLVLCVIGTQNSPEDMLGYFRVVPMRKNWKTSFSGISRALAFYIIGVRDKMVIHGTIDEMSGFDAKPTAVVMNYNKSHLGKTPAYAVRRVCLLF